jgi:hypothetical protein
MYTSVSISIACTIYIKKYKVLTILDSATEFRLNFMPSGKRILESIVFNVCVKLQAQTLYEFHFILEMQTALHKIMHSQN